MLHRSESCKEEGIVTQHRTLSLTTRTCQDNCKLEKKGNLE